MGSDGTARLASVLVAPADKGLLRARCADRGPRVDRLSLLSIDETWAAGRATSGDRGLQRADRPGVARLPGGYGSDEGHVRTPRPSIRVFHVRDALVRQHRLRVEGTCEAVLLRAGEPVFGTEFLRQNRGGITKDRLIASGPARLAQAFGIAKTQNGASLLRGGDLWCAEDADTQSFREGEIAQTVRIGLGEGRGQEIPWRFVVPGHPHASRRT